MAKKKGPEISGLLLYRNDRSPKAEAGVIVLVEVAGHQVAGPHILLDRDVNGAAVHGEGTPGVETAPRWWVYR